MLKQRWARIRGKPGMEQSQYTLESSATTSLSKMFNNQVDLRLFRRMECYWHLHLSCIFTPIDSSFTSILKCFDSTSQLLNKPTSPQQKCYCRSKGERGEENGWMTLLHAPPLGRGRGKRGERIENLKNGMNYLKNSITYLTRKQNSTNSWSPYVLHRGIFYHSCGKLLDLSRCMVHTRAYVCFAITSQSHEFSFSTSYLEKKVALPLWTISTNSQILWTS